ncbi:CoA ester lyase [Tessaracoccus coleopterorum]|uniref:CoA ester lyase n=1 Tax=Tessaracoccus coleopterorum TaxID=2714950 RepID=UPI0018D3F6E6|nr:CoA ester lyase [Tessaracoccus coleopterorum]
MPGAFHVQVRVNAPGTPWHDADVDAVAQLPPWVGARIPKAESVDVVTALATRLPGRGLHLLLESALGIEHAFDLARCPQVLSLGMGRPTCAPTSASPPTRASTGPRPRRQRGQGRRAAVAADVGLDPRHRPRRARRELPHGSLPRLPRPQRHPPHQLETIREAFRPTDDETARARLVLERIEGAVSSGTGALQLADGTFLDLAMVESARHTLALAHRLG